MIRMFVYGTLMTGEANHHVVAPYVCGAEPGAVRGRLYDVGGYPALVLASCEEGAIVQGEWLQVTEDALPAMDALEEYYGPGDGRNDYDRVRVTDIDGKRSGWAYVWPDPRGCPEIRSGSWRAHRRRSGR